MSQQPLIRPPTVIDCVAAGISGVGSIVGQGIERQYHELETYKHFCMVFTLGCCFIAISIFLLPTIVVTPATVANFFNIGSVLILGSFAVLWGPKEFCYNRFIFSERQKFAIGYFVALILCLYFGITKNRILCLLTLLIEVAFMLYFVASYFPGGQQGVTKLLETVWALIQSCFRS